MTLRTAPARDIVRAMEARLVLIAGLSLLAAAPARAEAPCAPAQRGRTNCTMLPMAVAARPCPPLGSLPPMAIGGRARPVACGGSRLPLPPARKMSAMHEAAAPILRAG